MIGGELLIYDGWIWFWWWWINRFLVCLLKRRILPLTWAHAWGLDARWVFHICIFGVFPTASVPGLSLFHWCLRLLEEPIELALQAMSASCLSFILLVYQALNIIRLSGLPLESNLLQSFNFMSTLILHQHLNFFFLFLLRWRSFLWFDNLFLHLGVRFIFNLDFIAQRFLVKLLINSLTMDNLVHQLSINIKSWVFVVELLLCVVLSVLNLHISIYIILSFTFFLDLRLVSILVRFTEMWILSFSFFFGILD